MTEKSFPSRTSRYERNWAGTSSIGSIVAMTHPTAVLLFALTVVVMAVIAEHVLPDPIVLMHLTFAMVFAQAAIGMFNEVFDYEIDLITKPWRALPTGLISIKRAKMLALGFCILGLVFAAVMSISSMLLLALGIGMGILYSAILKRSAFSWLPYVIAYPLPPVWVWVSLGKFEPHILYIYPIAIPFAIAVHLCNQLRDFDQDLALGVRGLVQRLGKRKAVRLCSWLLVFSPIPMLAFSLSLGLGGLPLLPSSVLHWSLILPIHRAGDEPPPEFFRMMFKRLQLTGPIMLLSWLVVAGF